MIVTEAVETYLESLPTVADPLLAEMEAFAARHDVPIAHRDLSRLLAVLARACGARNVLEVGLAIGYTALQVARALPDDGKVIALEVDEEMVAVARDYLARDPAGAKVEIVVGDARETLPARDERFDLVFIDADKVGYEAYLELSLPRLAGGALLVLDNLLMDGTVAEGRGNDHWRQSSVDAARALNGRLAADPQLDFILMPLGDGVGIVQQMAM